jgi:hypothetical protein
MALSKKEFSDYIKQFNFRELFNDMGWNNDKTTQSIVVDNETYTLQAVGEKSGFKIMLCNPQPNGLLPDYNTRKKIETKVTKLFQEHLIIFFDTKKTEQIWQLVVRQSGKPTKVTETRWNINQDPELLYQRAAGIFFELDEEDKITIVDVKNRVGENFHQNNEKVTKQFYDKFKKEHSSFLQFIKGISDKANQDWYASLMLNRLMFCYFIQKKGFLDNNKNYLRDKLKACKERKGKIKFYSFYRDFLLVLFHKGLNEPDQKGDVKIEIGKIPYLNGGLFDEHELEKTNTGIEIDDIAFERLFDFFDQYEWHLDTSVTATGKDINPDVIGYIFEKYINDRANMGAYYTKEDITDYISKNCILPYLFDETKRNYPKGFNIDSELWQMLKTSGDEYIYDAVKKGVADPLPKEINQGIKEISKRTEWNNPATINYALPTEIWREVIDRRNRYKEVKTKIDKGEIKSITDFVTYNLNIRQYTQDVVENTNDPELLKHFYKALNSVTIIDPTCGSGAFLFAAMNILEPLYESCIQRMENFVAEAKKGKYEFFEKTLALVKSPEHPNLQYFIYKSIILRNLYGVDIMKEAVEIAKLRLFLKLVATVEVDYKKPNLGLEPLPDIDFNIRAGNTLVGFANEFDLQKGLTYTLDGAIAKPIIEEKCEIVSNAFKRYKEIQLTYGDDFKEFKKAKEELNKRLKELNFELNQLLHRQVSGLKFDNWLYAHQPFHWFAEFYEIVHSNGGFDVIIGNPPYVEYAGVKKTYTVKDYETEKCNNLFALCTERSYKIMNSKGYLGLIIQLSAVTTITMQPLQKFLLKNSDLIFSSFYPERPQHLFDGAHIGLTIIISTKKKETDLKLFTSSICRTYKENRSNLFMTLTYASNPFHKKVPYFLKAGKIIETSILSKLLTNSSINKCVSPSVNDNVISYRTAGGMYWRTAICRRFTTTSTSNKTNYLLKQYSNYVIAALINSTTFWIYYAYYYDLFNFKDYMIFAFPFSYDKADKAIIQKLEKLGKKLMKNIDANVVTGEKYMKAKNQIAYFESFNTQIAKPVIDEIDMVLAEHYRFTDEELDFIVNFDTKYRMTRDTEIE